MAASTHNKCALKHSILIFIHGIAYQSTLFDEFFRILNNPAGIYLLRVNNRNKNKNNKNNKNKV